MKDKKVIGALLADIASKERQVGLVEKSRHSDARHAVTARRYGRALRVFRQVLAEHEHDSHALDDPLVREVASALGVDVTTRAKS